jgi:hypothetical protein
MLIEVIEKYWVDKMECPIYEWLGISQVTWCQQKKSKIAKKHLDKIFTHFDIKQDTPEHQAVKMITNTYYGM